MYSIVLALKPWAAIAAFGWLGLVGLTQWRGFWQLSAFLLVAGEVIGIIMMGDQGPLTLTRVIPPLAWGAALFVGMAILRRFLQVNDDF